MQAVHPTPSDAQQLIQLAAADDIDRFTGQHGTPPLQAFMGGIDIGIQRAAQMHVDQLRTSADAQYWRMAGYEALQQVEFQLVTSRVQAHVQLHFAAVQVGLNVVPAANDQAVQMLWQGAGRGKPQRPAAVTPDGKPVEAPGKLAFVIRGRDADQGSRHGQTVCA